MLNYYHNYCKELSTALQGIDEQKLDNVFDLIYQAYLSGNRIFVLGNGGSAAAASHWVCDFAKGINLPGKPRMKMVALGDNLSILTAIANDISYDNVFDYQLQNLAQPGDVVIALTVSGNSANLIAAFNWAKSSGCHTASIIGDFGGKIIACSEVAVVVPSKNYGIVEDIHMSIDHVFSQHIKQLNIRP